MWLIALAVPVQGYAAVAMVSCGPGHQSMVGTSSPVVGPDDRSADVPQHSHEGYSALDSDHHHDEMARAGHAHLLKGHDTSGKTGKGSCSPCASCCVVAALPSAVVEFQPVPLVDSFVPLAPRELTLFLTEGLERPPRLFLV